MRTLTKCGLILALGLISSSALAQPAPDHESVTVPGERPALPEMKADLDPTKDKFGGLTGMAIARDIRPEDRTTAFQELAKSLTGPLDKTYEWHGVYDQGAFIPTREYEEAGLLCRDFWEHTQHRGTEGFNPLEKYNFDDRPSDVPGRACRESDGWHFR